MHVIKIITPDLVVLLVIYGLFFTAELAEVLRTNFSRRLAGKCMFWFCLAGFFLVVSISCVVASGGHPSLWHFAALIAGAISAFSLGCYLLFGGLLVLIRLLRRIEKEEKPSLVKARCNLEVIAQRPLLVYFLASIPLIAYVPFFYGIYLYFRDLLLSP